MGYSYRLECMGQEKYIGLTVLNNKGDRHFNGVVICHDELLFLPLHWKKSTTIFVNSMSDLFHQKVPFDFIWRAFQVMKGARWHRFQILTKRSKRLRELSPQLPWPRNIWMGVSVEDAKHTFRIDDLRHARARIKFLSLEPLLGPLPSLDLDGIDWVIVGGESGAKARPMAREWVADIRDQCGRAGVSFFFKQWGHLRNNPDPDGWTVVKQNGGKAKGGWQLEGRTWDEMPVRTRRTKRREPRLNGGRGLRDGRRKRTA